MELCSHPSEKTSGCPPCEQFRTNPDLLYSLHAEFRELLRSDFATPLKANRLPHLPPSSDRARQSRPGLVATDHRSGVLQSVRRTSRGYSVSPSTMRALRPATLEPTATHPSSPTSTCGSVFQFVRNNSLKRGKGAYPFSSAFSRADIRER